MANLPNPESYEQLLADMLSEYASKIGTDDFNVGSLVTSFFEVVALTTARASGDIFQILRDYSVDRATGDALKRLALENRVPLVTAKPSTGTITVTDTSFNKISTKIYAGASSPNIGSTQIKVSDGSEMSATGSIYLGRGTPNIEGPLPYTSVAQTGGFWTVTLASPTTKFHNIGETVIVAQGGNRSIPISTVVVSPSSGSSPDIQFTVTTAAVILDGEVSVQNVPVSAQEPGSSGKIPRGAIKQFANPPFSGATVTNELPFVSGRDSETNSELRVRVKRQLASKGLATATAVKSSVIGASPSDEQATIVSAEIFSDMNGATVVVDDGNGYEEKSTGVGKEAIVDSALGGEQFFQVATGGRQAPIAKAFLQSTISAPFDIIGGDTLAITVGETTYQHVFNDSDFRSPGGVTAFEVTASVNTNTTLGFEALTAEGGTAVSFRAKEEGNDSVQVATPTTNGRNAAVQLGLPSNRIETLRLYKNKLPLSKDGNTASLFTQNQQLWSATMVSGDTLILAVDSTASITYTVTDADFVSTGLYTSVSFTNSLESWAQVLNAKLTGITVTVVGQQLKITSNLGAANRAKIVIDPLSTLVTKGMFSASLGLSSQGKASDFNLRRNYAQFSLASALVAGDELSGGSEETEARIESSQIAGGSITFTSDAHLWLLIDSIGELVPTALTANTLLAISKPASNTLRYTSTVTTAFINVQVGDYVIVWSNEVNINDRLEGRVAARTNSSIDIVITPSEYAAAVTTNGVVFQEGIVILRSDYVPQKFRITSGAKTLNDISDELQAQTSGLIFSVLEDQYLAIRSRTKDTTGRILVVSADAQGKFLNLPAGSSDSSKDSLIAFYDNQAAEASLPLFVHAGFASGSAADPIDSYISSVTSSISLSGRDPNELMRMLHPYGAINDAQAYEEYAQESSIAGAVIGIAINPNLRRVRSNDRYFLANPLDFGFNDTAVAVLDNDSNAKSFEIPFFRKGKTNTSFATNPTSFNAYDTDSGPTTNFSSAFGSFDFSNFKALMKARKVLKAAGVSQSAILYRSASWGRTGEKMNVGYIYPSIPNADISSTVQVDSTIDIRINLKSGAVVPSSIDASTEWNVTITANTPVAGIDQVTYTWSGTGTNPALGLSGGEYVNITSQSEFSEQNIGIFRISDEPGFTPSSTSFSVQRPTGEAVAEVNRATIVSSAISFYNKNDTTAAEIVTYVTASLSDYVTGTLVNDSGTSGSGIISLSTHEDTAFVSESVSLKDGINWIASSNLGSSPQFVFKKALDLVTDTGYAFNNGEEIRLIPTTMDQVKRLTSVLAVTGLTTVGTVGVVDRGSRLELATDVLGSSGAIQIIGGLANKYEVPVLDSAIRLDNQLSMISTDKVAAQGIQADQWFKLEASMAQRKDTLLSSNSSVTVLGNDPTTGQSTIKLSGRSFTQRYFGKPRHQTRVRGRKFRIEKQGSLVCMSWDGSGSSPSFIKSTVNFNASGGGTLNIEAVTGTSEADVIIMSGQGNFNELSIGNLVTLASLPTTKNNGTFLVTGVSDDGNRMRILNPDAENEFSKGSFSLNTNLTAGDQFTIDVFTLTADTDFAIGATAADTATNFAAVAGTLSGVSAEAVSNLVTITSTISESQPSLAFSGVGTVVTTQMVGDSYTGSTFSASTEVSEGDTVTVSSPFALLNQGRFRVIRRYNDSIWFENPNVIEEEVLMSNNYVSLGFDGTTSFKVNASNHSQHISWNGSGTEPSLENAEVGDVVTFGSDFASNNQGEFMVIGSGEKLQQITNLVMPTGGQFTLTGIGKYFTINSAGDMDQYYVWFNVNSTHTDPTPIGLTGIEVAILSGDTATQVAAKAAAVLGVATGLTATSSDNTVTVTTTGYQDSTAADNVNVPSPFSVDVVQAGRRTFFECVNPSATNESSVLVSGTLNCHRSQILFHEYEATVAGDIFVSTGNTLTSANAGLFTISRVIDRNNAIVTGSMVSASNVSLNGLETSVYVQEGTPYTGYKHVLLATVQPGAPSRTNVVFDTNAQYEKINEAAEVQISSLNKMDYETVIKKGLDSYRYNTGLIAEANRIVYGDARDEETYPGVGAAGAEIYFRAPLTRRIQLSIVIRIATGVPFAQIAEQVRTSVSSLINSNEVGQSIAISAIVSVVNSIPGAKAVAINSPQYDSTHDLIKLAPSEKARIIDPTTDISVSQNGN